MVTGFGRKLEDTTNDSAELTFTILFYCIYAAVLAFFWYVFRSNKFS